MKKAIFLLFSLSFLVSFTPAKANNSQSSSLELAQSIQTQNSHPIYPPIG